MSAPLVDRLHRSVVDDDARTWSALSPSDRRARLVTATRLLEPLLDDGAVQLTVDEVLARVVGLGPLEPLLADPAVSEVMVNGGGAVFIERGGRLAPTDLVLAETAVLQLIERVVAPLGLRIDRSSPIVDARLLDGSRVNAVIRPVAVDGPCLTIRRFGVRDLRLEAFSPAPVAALLTWAVRARLNIIVSGGTGAGKTTLLNALAGAVPEGERIITIEDTAELRLAVPHVVRLEARPPNTDGEGALPIRELVRNALRMRPDRIIVGEVRGGEALDMLQAMNTGHEGSLSTCHANGPLDAVHRLETMVLMAPVELPLPAVREQLAAAVDLIAHVTRRADGGREIGSVHEVVAERDSPGETIATTVVAHRDRVVALPRRPPRAPETPPLDWTGLGR